MKAGKGLFFSWCLCWFWRDDGAAGERCEAWTWIHVEGFFIDTGAPDLFAFDVGGDQLEIYPGPQIMIVPVDIASHIFIGKFSLSAVEHDRTGGPGGVVFFFEILYAREDDNAENFVGIFHFNSNGDGVRFTAAPVYFFRRILQRCKPGSGNR